MADPLTRRMGRYVRRLPPGLILRFRVLHLFFESHDVLSNITGVIVLLNAISNRVPESTSALLSHPEIWRHS